MVLNNLKFVKGTDKRHKGFTLMELILVILILSIMGAGISSFISLSTQTYVNATNRDEVIGNARFVIERLNRELRNAVPNSIRVKTWFDRIQCIQFTPIVASSVYTDIPVSPEPASSIISVIPFLDINGDPYECDRENTSCRDLVTVYPLQDDDIYADPTLSVNKIFQVYDADMSTAPYEIEFSENIHFKEDSPTQRLYIVNEQVSYCNVIVEPPNIWGIGRYSESNISSGEQTIPGSVPDYMAGYLIEDISAAANLPFTYYNATLKRNAVVQIHLHLVKEDEDYVFDHEVHINNVP